MRMKWSHLFVFLGILAMAFVVGCADDDEDNNNNTNPQTDPLIGTWLATASSLNPLGIDEASYFLRSDTTYTYYTRFASTEIRENGRWHSTVDSLYFHVQNYDNVPADTSYALWYDLSANEDTLRVRYLFDQLYTVTYIRD